MADDKSRSKSERKPKPAAERKTPQAAAKKPETPAAAAATPPPADDLPNRSARNWRRSRSGSARGK